MKKANLYDEELNKYLSGEQTNDTSPPQTNKETGENKPQSDKGTQATQTSTPQTNALSGQNNRVSQTTTPTMPTAPTKTVVPEYSSQWKGELDNLMKQIMNREKFSFDLNGDAMYQQYAEMYGNNANRAMQNAMGQTAAMSGGYGSSYSQMAGQQAYAQEMQGLNDVAIDLYGQALNQYLAEGDALNQRYAMMADREAQDYARYLDSVNRANYEDEIAYGQYRDSIADAQWRESFDREGDQWEKLYGDGGFYVTEREDSQAHDKEMQKESQDFTKDMSEQERKWANEDWDKMYGEDGYYVTEADKDRQHDKENRDFLYGYFDENGVYHDGYYGRESDKEFDRMYGEDGYYTKRDGQDQENWQAEFDRAGKQWDALYGEGGINNPSFTGNFMYDEEGNLRDGYTTTNTNLFDESGNFKQASIAQKIPGEDGKSGYVEWNVGGKTIKLQQGYNPYTQTKNPDVKNGTFGDGGYQPDNVASYYGNDEKAVSKSKLTPAVIDGVEKELEVNGVWQTVYKDNAGRGSRYWVWDDANNEYIDVTEQMKKENPELPLKPNNGNTSTSTGKGTGGKSTYDPFTAVNR